MRWQKKSRVTSLSVLAMEANEDLSRCDPRSEVTAFSLPSEILLQKLRTSQPVPGYTQVARVSPPPEWRGKPWFCGEVGGPLDPLPVVC